jgi:16S rRNA (cytosine967-C5)-methyltransferase
MNILGVGTKVLREIIDGRKPVSFALSSLEEEFNLSSEENERIKRDINGSLKHFYLLRFEAEDAFSAEKDDSQLIYLTILALYQLRYCLKSIARFKTIDEATEAKEYLGLEIDSGVFRSGLEKLSLGDYHFPAAVMRDPYKYNSLVFSIPEWIIRMWAKQYGDEQAMSLLHSSQMHKLTYVRINDLKISKEELLSEGVYEDSQFASEAYVYHSPLSFSQSRDSKEGRAFIEDLSNQIAISSLNLKEVRKAVQLNGFSGSLSSDLAMRIQPLGGTMETVYPDEVSYRKARYAYQRRGLANVSALHYSSLEEAEKVFKKGTYDLAVATPDSSCLGQISYRPSKMAILKEEEMPELIAGEKKTLEAVASLVKEGGKLLYMVWTVNLAEGEQLVRGFLKKHSDFSLQVSKQIFPYEYPSDGLYYAVMERGGHGR